MKQLRKSMNRAFAWRNISKIWIIKIDINISSVCLSPSKTASLKIPSLLKPAFIYAFLLSNWKNIRLIPNGANSILQTRNLVLHPLPKFQYPFPLQSFGSVGIALPYLAIVPLRMHVSPFSLGAGLVQEARHFNIHTIQRTKRANWPNQNQLALFLWIMKKCCQIVATEGSKPWKIQSYQGFPAPWTHSHSLLLDVF